MSNDKMLAFAVFGGIALIAIVVGVFLSLRTGSSRGTARSAGERLLAHSGDRSDYRMFVGIPAANPVGWAEVAKIDATSLTLQNSLTLDLSQVTAYFVAYPSGMLVDCQRPHELPLPKWVGGLHASDAPDADKLTAADLKKGLLLVRVGFGKSTSKPSSRDHYSTTLTNVSGKRVRVLKFGGYTKAGNGFSLNTITSHFFTAEDFKEWYGQKGEWIDPGQSVTDPNNYGTPPCLWAYYCETEGGETFLTGGIIK
jgi:hypothetical protein